MLLKAGVPGADIEVNADRDKPAGYKANPELNGVFETQSSPNSAKPQHSPDTIVPREYST
jgi:hypothetical protein